jgi:murein DD-endopeptidase
MMWITSPFGHRHHPTKGGRHLHTGIDIAAPVGAPVVACLAGRVVRIDRDGRGKGAVNGNAVHVRTGDHVFSYLHLDRVAVHDGQPLARGELLGTVGVTGRTSGPHLHLQLAGPEGPIDPLPLFARSDWKLV